jgi:hypothetical protein
MARGWSRRSQTRVRSACAQALPPSWLRFARNIVRWRHRSAGRTQTREAAADKKCGDRLIDEHRRRIGDPAPGGSTRQPIMTAYRQQALACAASLARGPRRTSELRGVVPQASSILLRNVYGWFTRIERGFYELTPEGAVALARWSSAAPAKRHRQIPLSDT